MFDLIKYITSKDLEDQSLSTIQEAIDELQVNLFLALEIRDKLKNQPTPKGEHEQE